MAIQLTSRERMLRAMRCQPPDHVPCAFMIFAAMRGRCQDAYEAIRRELEMGLDAYLFVPSAWRNERPEHPDLRGLPVRYPADVRTDLWLEERSGGQLPVLHKVYHTPAGDLSTDVSVSDDWPHGNRVPLMDDYQVPRATKPLVTGPEDLEPLRTMLLPPAAEDVAAFQREMARARAFQDAHGVALFSGWGVGADMAGWLCGLERLALLAYDAPEFLSDLLALIDEWNRRRMAVALEAGVDLFIRRGWYEGTDFWSPAMFRRFLLPILAREAALAHERGALYGYIQTAGVLPMLGMIQEAGVDVLIGADPTQRGERPMETMRDALSDRVCLWGGVNGAVTVEEGSAEDVVAAVTDVMATMAGVPGFILSPVDNVRAITRRAWHNVDVLVETWQRLRGGP